MSATVMKDGLAGQVEEAPVSGDIGGTAMDVDIDVEQLPQALRELVTQLRAVPATIKEVDLAGPDQGGDYFRMDPSADVEDDAGDGAVWYRRVRLWVLGLIGTCPSLRVVKLGDWASAVNCGISSESEVERLCEGLKSNQVLRWLSLDGNVGFGSEFGCRQVSHILASCSSSLVTLGMFGVGLKAAGLSQLLSTVLANKAGSRLQVLNVESNPECLADERAARLLGQLVSRKCLRKLGIQRTGLTVAGAALISAALGATALQTLQVGGGPEPILNVIVSSLSRCRRLSLLFTKEDLEEEASQIAEPLAQMLRTNTSLRKLTLHMKSVGLKAAGLSQLLSTLLANKAGSRLQILDVEHNPECLADERAAQLLGQLVSRSKGLWELRIRETGLTVAGAALISAALKGATALQRLQVGGGPEPILNVIVSSHSRCSELHLLFCKEDVEEEASQLAEPLAQMLRTNTSLRKLWLENADFSTKAWRCIFQALGAANSTLSFLSLGGSTTLDHGLIDDLYQLLASNPRLALAEIRNAPLKGPSRRTLESGGFFYCTCSSCRQLHLGEGPGCGGEILNVEQSPKELRPLIAALTAVPSLSPGLFQASLHFLLENWCTLTNDGTVNVELEVDGPEVKVFLDEVCQSFAAELVTLLGSSLGGGAVQEEGGSDYILQQLSLCLLLALAPAIPNACEIKTSETWSAYKPRYGGEQAVEVQVLYSALLSQHWSNSVRRLKIGGSGAFGSDRGCKHLAHLLKSGHCKLQELQILSTSTGAGGMRHISRALQTNCSLTVLDIGGCKVGDGGVEQLAASLRTNSTLQDLTLIEIGMSAHGLRHLCDALQSTQPWRLQATSSSPGGTRHNMHTGGVKKLKISHNAFENGGVALLGAMLANNSCLESLEASHCNLVEEDGEGHLGKGLQENSTLQELDISVNPMLGKVALGLLVRSLATNGSTALKTLQMNEVKKMPAAEELAHMIISNRSLENLGMGGAEYEYEEWVTIILPALGRNTTLLFIDLSSCQEVKGEVRAALFHLLRINTTIQQIELLGTPLYLSGQAEGVQVELRRNGEFRHALSALPQAKPKSCRIVLCGNAYAGKSKLFETMKLLALQEDPQAMTSSSKDWMERLLLDRSSHNYDNLKDKELSKRTRGIEIHLLKDELDCRISVWDLVDNEPKFLATVGGKIGTIVGAYLHDAGEVIHHAMLNLIVTNPKWFCHGVLGQLIDLFPSSQRPLRPKNGFVTRVYLSSLLQEAMESVQGFDPTIMTPDQLIQIMLLSDLCYEQTPGDPNTDYFLPAIFEDEGNKAADGKRPVTWRKLKSKASTFVGRRLQCTDLQRTFLTDGFFPRLQVVLHNYVFKKKWIANKHSNTYMLEKNLFSIWVNSMEILIEFSGSSGDFVDILVKSSKSRQQVMEFLGPNIIGTIRTFCASQEGCQGVTLAEAIIRPDCLYGAEGGNPILCTYRRDQSILVVELTEKMKLLPDYDHCWDKVEDNVGGLVLPDGQDSGTLLLEGTQDVAPGPEPSSKWPGVEDSCYPNNNRKQGRKRGLALIVSMEKERPGGAVDRGTLRTLAVGCGFDEIVLVDRKASELSSIINSVVEDVLEEDECFVCFISGHGGTENGKPFILDEEKLRIMVNPVIVDPFRRSKHLQGKPKIFVINGCRGSTQYVHSDSVGADTDTQQVTGSLLPHVTELSDCLLVFSTSEGFPSCRDPLAGTVFVNQFMQTVLGKKETTDVLSMMTMVE